MLKELRKSEEQLGGSWELCYYYMVRWTHCVIDTNALHIKKRPDREMMMRGRQKGAKREEADVFAGQPLWWLLFLITISIDDRYTSLPLFNQLLILLLAAVFERQFIKWRDLHERGQNSLGGGKYLWRINSYNNNNKQKKKDEIRNNSCVYNEFTTGFPHLFRSGWFRWRGGSWRHH